MNDETRARMTLYPTSSRRVSAAILELAAHEARTALMNGWQEVIECPHCTNGSVTHHGSMWWQTTKRRCFHCQGTGLAYPQATSGQSRSSSAVHAERVGSFPDSFNHAPGADDE